MSCQSFRRESTAGMMWDSMACTQHGSLLSPSKACGLALWEEGTFYHKQKQKSVPAPSIGPLGTALCGYLALGALVAERYCQSPPQGSALQGRNLPHPAI